MNKYEKAVNEAKKFLNKHSRDKAHDLAHHQAVWKNCQNIVSAEKPKINLQLLKVATYWHDVVLDEIKWPSKLNVEETCIYLSSLLPKLRFDDNEVQNIIATVQHHEFRDTPKTNEGMVLQDADKLETVSIERWNRTLTDHRKGRMTKENITSYLRTFLQWSPILTATFYYPSSRVSAENNLRPVWIEKQWEKVFEDFNLKTEYLKAKQSKNLIKTRALRLLIRIKNLFTRIRLQI